MLWMAFGENEHDAANQVAYGTMKTYCSRISTIIGLVSNTPPENLPNAQLSTRMLRKAIKRVKGDRKQRARELRLHELERFLAWVGHTYGKYSWEALSLTLIVMTAFLGACRLGALTVESAREKRAASGDVDVVRFRQYEMRGDRTDLVLEYSKTIQFKERQHRVALFDGPFGEYSVSSVLQELRTRYPIRDNMPICWTPSRIWTFERVVGALNAAIPPLQPTPFTKGHFTGHSMRRGFVHLALELGVKPQFIQLHGDWKSMKGFLNYAAGAVIAHGVLKRLAQLRR